jgi:hypothetical protein
MTFGTIGIGIRLLAWVSTFYLSSQGVICSATDLVGLTLRKRLLKAVKELQQQRDGLEEFSEAQGDQVPVWKQMVDDFESGASLVNPYQLPKSGTSYL